MDDLVDDNGCFDLKVARRQQERIESMMQTTGYREGVFEGKEEVSQATLDRLFPISSSVAFFLGALQGTLKAQWLLLELPGKPPFCADTAYNRLKPLVSEAMKAALGLDPSTVSAFASALARLGDGACPQQAVDPIFSALFQELAALKLEVLRKHM